MGLVPVCRLLPCLVFGSATFRQGSAVVWMGLHPASFEQVSFLLSGKVYKVGEIAEYMSCERGSRKAGTPDGLKPELG